MSDTPSYEPTIIPHGAENPTSWDHPKISNAFSPLVVTEATGQAGKYELMRLYWEQGFETFLRSVQASIAQAWSGPAAEQSIQAIRGYIDNHARPVTPALEALSNGISAAASAIVDTKNAIGDPLTTDGLKGWLNETFQDDEISRRTAVAQSAMTTKYVDPFALLDRQIPVIPVPVGPTSTPDIPEPPPGGYNPDTGNPSTTTSGNPTGTTPGAPNGETPQAPVPPQGEVPGDEQPDRPTTTSPGETTMPAGTETPATVPTVPANTTPAGVTAGPGAPGGAPPGAPGSPSTPETPGPGRTVQGAPPTTGPGAPTGVAAPPGSTTAGTRGMGGMPMGAAGAGRGGGQDDESNRSVPDYLINQENTDELLGEIPPTIEGGVIGSNPE